MSFRSVKIFPMTVSLFLCQIGFAAGPDLSVAPKVGTHLEQIRGKRAQFTIEVGGLSSPVNRSIEVTGPA